VNSLCFTGDGTSNHAGFDLQAARVSVEDLVAPEIVAAPDSGFHRPAVPIAVSATDSAGVRSLRVLVDNVERVAERRTCDYRLTVPCPTSASTPFDLVGILDGRHTITTIAEDAASNITRIERTVDLDGTPPVVTRVPVSGRTISALISDASSGVVGGAIEIRGRREAPFLALKTTLQDGKLVATVPRTVKGSYGIRVSASDKAGNTLSALVTSMSLSTRVGKHARKVQNERATVGYGRAVTVLGRLTTTDGSPVANQSIVISGTLRQTGATAQPVAIAPTDTGGRFSVTLPAGPSRSLSVVYPGAQGILTRTRAVALRVPASSTIRAAAKSIRGAGSVASPAACACSAPRCPPAARSSTSRPPSAAAGPPSPPRGRPAPAAAGTPPPASAAHRAATRSACASAARRCSPMNWGTPLPWRCAYGENRSAGDTPRDGRNARRGRPGRGGHVRRGDLCELWPWRGQ
jgi:hypothetical protein